MWLEKEKEENKQLREKVADLEGENHRLQRELEEIQATSPSKRKEGSLQETLTEQLH